MNTLTLDLLSSLLSNIEDSAIGQLSITSKTMENITKELKDHAIFNKTRVEKLLGYPIDSKGDWKGFYSILIKSDPSKSNWLSSALGFATDNGNYLAVEVLLADQRVDPSYNNNRAILLASQHGYLEIVRLLLADSRVDPSADDNLIIIEASEHGYTEIIKLLLANKKVDPSDNHNHAIWAASIFGKTEVVKLLLGDNRVNPSDYYNEAIHSASQHGNKEVVKLLLGSDKIDLSTKKRALEELYRVSGLGLRGYNMNYDIKYDFLKFLSTEPIFELIQMGNDNLDFRNIIMTKYFWWLRLKILYNMDNVKGDPFEVALQQELSHIKT